MSSMRYVGLTSGLCLLALAGPVTPRVSAQSAEPGETGLALLTLQHEVAEPLLDITPELLDLQQSLVDSLKAKADGVSEEYRVGQRTLSDYLAAQQAYWQELETLQVMEARSNDKSVSKAELLKIRIGVRSQALSDLKRGFSETENRYTTGEVTHADVADAKAHVLKAEILIEGLKQAAARVAAQEPDAAKRPAR